MVEVTKKADESCRKLTFNVDVSLVAQLHSYVTAYTANVYRDLQGVYREIRMREFQIYGDWGNPMTWEVLDHKIQNDLTRDWTIQYDAEGGVLDS